MVELHSDICGVHKARFMASRVLRARYYCPILRKDVHSFIQECQECQKFGPIYTLPPEELHSIITPWSFTTWRMDIVYHFPMAKEHVKFLIVAIDYFTRCIEAKPLVTITSQQVQKISWKNIICKHELSNCIVTDDRRQSTNKGYEQFLQQLSIKHRVTFVEHLQINGQAKIAKM